MGNLVTWYRRRSRRVVPGRPITDVRKEVSIGEITSLSRSEALEKSEINF